MIESPVQNKAMPAEVIHLDTRVLLARHVKGDPNAFPQFVDKFRCQVFSYLVRCGVPYEARDDLFQEIFLKVHHAAPTYEPDRALEPWFFTIVANSVRSFFRKQIIQQRLHGELESDVTQKLINDEDQVEVLETTEWLERQITFLPPKQREVIVLCCIDELSRKEVAQILNCPVGTVKTHLHRARATLAKALSERDNELDGDVLL